MPKVLVEYDGPTEAERIVDLLVNLTSAEEMKYNEAERQVKNAAESNEHGAYAQAAMRSFEAKTRFTVYKEIYEIITREWWRGSHVPAPPLDPSPELKAEIQRELRRH